MKRIKSYSCKTHGYSCTLEGIENHIAKEEELAKGRASCNIVISYIQEIRKGSEKTRERGYAPAIASKMIRQKAMTKDLKILDKKEVLILFSEREANRRIGITNGESNGMSTVMGHPDFWVNQDEKSIDYDVSYALAKKIQKVENLTEGWMKAMIANNHFPTKEQIAKYKDKMMHKICPQVLYGIGIDMYDMNPKSRNDKIVQPGMELMLYTPPVSDKVIL